MHSGSIVAELDMLEIRQYQVSDQDAVWELHNLGLNQVGAHLGNGPWDDDVHDVLNQYINNGGEFLVGVLDGRVVCMGALKRKSAEQAEIKRMRVHPDYQRRGFGQMILSRLEKRAAQLGFTELCLDTTTRQMPAQRLYERNGYSEVHRGRIAGLEVVFYMKDIKPR